METDGQRSALPIFMNGEEMEKYDSKAFYRRVISVALPIIIQNAISNFVSLLDNLMIGQVGTVQMSGVAIVNQLMFVFYLCVFGAVSGAGIFTAQFYGSKDDEGIRHTFRFKFLIAGLLTVLGISVFLVGGEWLIGFFLQGEGNPEDLALTLEYGREYMLIMLVGLIPFGFANAYASTLRETGKTMVPMIAGVSAVLVNLVLNYILIFGHFGAPAMGVAGAAVATVISRYVEFAIVVIWTHRNSASNAFIQGAYRSLKIPGPLMKQIIIKGMPLLVNEALWSAGMTMMNQCYSTRGLEVVAAVNIHSTINGIASTVFLSLGNVAGIIMGQMLGAGVKEKEIRWANNKLVLISVLSCFGFGGAMAALSGVFPTLYNTTETVRSTATWIICVGAAAMPFCAYANVAYFSLRSGGQTFVTFLFDSAFVWTVCVPLAFCLSRFTQMPIIPLFAICQSTEIIKVIIGRYLLKKGVWIRRIVNN